MTVAGTDAAGGDVLARIVRGTRARLAATPVDLEALLARARGTAPGPDALAALTAPGVRIIAEVKRRSPSAGAIRAQIDPVALAHAYAAGGAAAISVLTEPEHFGGALSDLEAVAASVPTPCLRKDFFVSTRQVAEARAAGAALVLLIAAVLDDAELVALREAAEALGMHALVEAHDAREVDRAVASGARIVGVNNRDLRTFRIDLATCEALRGRIPSGVVAVAESGIEGPADVSRLRASGYDVFLVGTALMRSGDPRAALTALIDAAGAGGAP